MSSLSRYYAYILLFAFLFSSCSSTKKLQYQPLDAALLWEITGKDLKEPSYLYGTIHLINTEDFYWPKGTLTAFEDSDKAIFEVDLNDMFDMGSMMSLFNKAMMKDGLSLQDILSVNEYKVVSDHFSDMGLPMFMLDKIKPMFLTVFASGDMEMGGINSDKVKSYEMELFELAKQREMEVSGLESIEYQMSVFDSIPYEDQAKMLVDAIENTDTDNDQFKEMIQTYKDQDIQAMVEMMKGEEAGIADHEDLLLTNRNKNWIPIMKSEMQKDQIFFAVGAGHLAGENGVIHLLRKEGLKLKPISKK